MRFEVGAGDYLAAVAGIEPAVRLPLTGTSEPTPWDEDLCAALLLGDLTWVQSHPPTRHPHR